MSAPASSQNTAKNHRLNLVSLVKLGHLVREQLLMRSSADSRANMQATLAEAYNGMGGSSSKTGNYQRPEDDMIVNDSPITNNHYPQSSWPKALIGAGLLATGIGLPVAGLLIADALKKPAVKEIIHDPGKVFQGDANVNVGKAIVTQPDE